MAIMYSFQHSKILFENETMYRISSTCYLFVWQNLSIRIYFPKCVKAFDAFDINSSYIQLIFFLLKFV